MKILLGQEPLAILHGGPVPRVVDHIEAFCICRGDGTQAGADLESAIRLQGEFLRLVPMNGGDQTDESIPGYIEIPPASFGETVLQASKQLPEVEKIRDHYVAELGHPDSWQDASSFSESVMTGTALPWMAIRIDGAPIAVSLRNAATL
ncbi:hypothetical protein [Metapseudomonas resinovorans]|uniref:hypothetical protein n=1 Tax=Metapseudomonas resinovorans TaxID=53412 RepID=UPI0012DD9F56|nr:hypothetical protein [Pseudomonas resinovorans]